MPFLLLAQNGTFYAFYACNAKHMYASTRVLRIYFILTPSLRKRILTGIRPKNWLEPLLGLCPTLPEGVGGVKFRVTASRVKLNKAMLQQISYLSM